MVVKVIFLVGINFAANELFLYKSKIKDILGIMEAKAKLRIFWAL
jgi:hypothetical protein